MTFKKMVLGAVSASGILLAASAIAPATLSILSAAQADTSISINFGFGSFYDRLEPYGNWVSYQDQYVFVPARVRNGWRPYTLGHWSYTNRYGWLWVSNEQFGWATYHYGRWGYSSDIGWYWVPGHRWAPAWVAWSRGQNEIAWAPLPPRYGDDLDVNITIGDVPDYYWQAVPASAFLSINLFDNVIRDRNQVRTIVQQSPPQTVRIENNVVINNVIQVNDIEKATNTKIKALVDKPVGNPDALGKTDANSIAIFNPDVKTETNAKPKKVLKVEEVVTQRKANGILPEDVPSDQPAAPAQPPTPAGKPAVNVQLPADSKTTTDIPATKQDKGTIDTAKPADLNSRKVQTPGKVDLNKGKDVLPAITPPPPVVAVPVEKGKPAVTAPADTGNATTNVPAGKSNKKKAADTVVPQGAQQNTQPQQTGQQPGDQNANKKNQKDGQGKPKCDPNVETCPPAQ